MKNEKIREFLTRLAQEEGFKDEFLKLKEKVEKNAFSKGLNNQLISDHFLPWSKKLGYELTKEDFIDFERTQKLPQVTGLSLEQLENVSGGFGFTMLLTALATFGSLIFGVGNGSTGNNTNANNDPVGTGLTSYSQTGAANQDYYDYAMSSVDDYDLYQARTSVADYEQNHAKSPLPENSPFSARKEALYKKSEIIEDNYRFLEEHGDDRAAFEEISEYRDIIQDAETDSDLNFGWAEGRIDDDIRVTDRWRRDHLRKASFDKAEELEKLIKDTWPKVYADYADSIAYSLLDEVQTLCSKAFHANTSDTIRTNGFEEEWKQLENKIHSVI